MPSMHFLEHTLNIHSNSLNKRHVSNGQRGTIAVSWIGNAKLASKHGWALWWIKYFQFVLFWN